jgi:hypothetical protein
LAAGVIRVGRRLISKDSGSGAVAGSGLKTIHHHRARRKDATLPLNNHGGKPRFLLLLLCFPHVYRRLPLPVRFLARPRVALRLPQPYVRLHHGLSSPWCLPLGVDCLARITVCSCRTSRGLLIDPSLLRQLPLSCTARPRGLSLLVLYHTSSQRACHLPTRVPRFTAQMPVR